MGTWQGAYAGASAWLLLALEMCPPHFCRGLQRHTTRCAGLW